MRPQTHQQQAEALWESCLTLDSKRFRILHDLWSHAELGSEATGARLHSDATGLPLEVL